MDFISMIEFKKQSEKIQKVLKRWWFENYHSNLELEIFWSRDYSIDRSLGENYFTLLAEGPLRKFIEEKTDSKVQIYYDGDCGYTLDIGYKDSFKEEHWGTYEKLGNDLLQTYWKVACKIAESEEV